MPSPLLRFSVRRSINNSSSSSSNFTSSSMQPTRPHVFLTRTLFLFRLSLVSLHFPQCTEVMIKFHTQKGFVQRERDERERSSTMPLGRRCIINAYSIIVRWCRWFPDRPVDRDKQRLVNSKSSLPVCYIAIHFKVQLTKIKHLFTAIFIRSLTDEEYWMISTLVTGVSSTSSVDFIFFTDLFLLLLLVLLWPITNNKTTNCLKQHPASLK